MKSVITIFFALVTFLCVSCNRFFLKAYGVKEIKPLSNDEIGAISEKLGISKQNCFVLDKEYFKAIANKDTGQVLNNRHSEMILKYVQPLQLLYFDSLGRLLSFHNNCYAPGFPKLKWNKEGQFNQFIPVSIIPITDTILDLEILISFLKPLDNTYGFQKSQTTIVLFWSDFLFKQSKELIKVARRNLKLDATKNSFIAFVNTDNCYTDEKFKDQINKRN